MPWLPASTTRKEVCPLMTSCKLSVVFTLWKVWTTILLCDGYCSLYHLPWVRGLVAGENSRHFATSPQVCSRNNVWKMSAEHTFWWHVTTWVVFLIGWNKLSANQKHYGVGHVIIMEFLHSFLGRHFLGKPVVASLNVGCFLRLGVWWVALISHLDALLTICWFYLY